VRRWNQSLNLPNRSQHRFSIRTASGIYPAYFVPFCIAAMAKVVASLMTVRKQIGSGGLLALFVFVVLWASLASAGIKPFGLYQRGKSHTGDSAAVRRAAARTFRIGFVSAKHSRSYKRGKNLYHASPSVSQAILSGEVSWPVESQFSTRPDSCACLSPVLNL
jgi:hypothetical protein